MAEEDRLVRTTNIFGDGAELTDLKISSLNLVTLYNIFVALKFLVDKCIINFVLLQSLNLGKIIAKNSWQSKQLESDFSSALC